MDKDKLQEIIEAHGKWLMNKDGGERANLREANLYRANLYRADLYGANLREANLYGANLCEANLREANLYGANLCEANLREANLYGANLREANLCGAILPERIVQAGPIGSRKDYTVYWIDRDVVQCGCWNEYQGGSLEEFKRRIDVVYPDGQYRQEYLAAIAMFDALKELRKK